MPLTPGRLEPGSPNPLGATWDGLGVNFAVFSAHATAMELCIYNAAHREVARYELPERTDQVWHGYLPDARPGLIYGFRAHGPYKPEEGHRFNPNKLLLDPYAKALSGAVKWNDSLFGYRLHSPRGDLSFDRRDSAPAMVKAVVTTEDYLWGDDRTPNTAWGDTVIYEAHVKGLTKLLQDVPEALRGSYAALGHPSVITHLQRLGITAIELMPVHAFLQDRHLLEKGLRNYWGYNTLGFFTPEPGYMSGGGTNELRSTIRRLHKAGIEVLMDVVYNHTCEGSELGPTLSWRGLDNASYYRLLDDNPRHTINDTGTGNVLDMASPRALQMCLDSLRHFVQSYHIDGFRFDLGATLGREHTGFDPNSGFFDAIRQDPVLSKVKLISEPWDIGPGGYQLGNHPPPFAEWNDRYRDTLRRYWRGDGGQRPELARRLSGSADIFGSRRPTASINYLASHDGAPLGDLVMYEGKHNEANGEDNRDGASDNLSCHWGVEGPSDDPAINTLRERVKRSMLLSIFASLGTPMLLAGDEFGNSQHGNNNAYCQDNELSWLDWTREKDGEGAAQEAFTARVIALRKRYAGLRSAKFLFGEEISPGFRNLDWLDERGQTLSEEDWANGEARALIMRRALWDGDNKIEVLYLLLNGSEKAIEFTLPSNWPWEFLIDSATPEREEGPFEGTSYQLEDRAAALFRALVEPPQ
ncbi:glycogen operon protein [Rhizomicrobium palustre]|uniref:Glycogen operon protein n=1 Tax=Rhizomicrobium palustre TaxID=189966 RepID=A0A846N1M4_9PROT|nr:glycogen debranching protein GlgX [Rhizomicrobium palustre]NIK89211.1 glycogen operon protein [Rhizomicrobium palustre]